MVRARTGEGSGIAGEGRPAPGQVPRAGVQARRAALIAAALGTTGALSACTAGADDGLPRELAAQRIAEAPPLQEVVRAQVLRNAGTRCAWHREHPTEAPWPVWQTLMSAGLIRLADTIPPADPSFPQAVCVPLLTAKGQQIAREQQWQETSRPGVLGVDHYWIVPMARRQVAEVTGVTEPPEGGNRAEAQFTWRWTLLTGGTAAPGLLPNEGGTGRAVLTRYDDGWRATGVALDGGQGR